MDTSSSQTVVPESPSPILAETPTRTSGAAKAESTSGSSKSKRLSLGVDDKKYVETVLAAAEANDGCAQWEMSAFYGLGLRGVEKDAAKCFFWAQKSADNNYPDGLSRLGFCYESGVGCTQNIVTAVSLYQQAIKAGSASALANLGCCYLAGNGVPKDEARAVEYFRESSDKGCAQGTLNLGICYANGTVVAHDDAAALKLFLKAAETDHPYALYRVGMSYELGLGVPANAKKAVEYYSLAAVQNEENAIRSLKRLMATGDRLSLGLDTATRVPRKSSSDWFGSSSVIPKLDQKSSSGSVPPAASNDGPRSPRPTFAPAPVEQMRSPRPSIPPLRLASTTPEPPKIAPAPIPGNVEVLSTKSVAEWSADEVCLHFQRLGLRDHFAVFIEQNITGELLVSLSDADLKEIGIPLGVRRRHQLWQNGRGVAPQHQNNALEQRVAQLEKTVQELEKKMQQQSNQQQQQQQHQQQQQQQQPE